MGAVVRQGYVGTLCTFHSILGGYKFPVKGPQPHADVSREDPSLLCWPPPGFGPRDPGSEKARVGRDEGR